MGPACPVCWGLPSSYVMLLIGLLSDVQVRYMPLCSFYNKTNIVILTCTSDIFPPVLPSPMLRTYEELSVVGALHLFLPVG